MFRGLNGQTYKTKNADNMSIVTVVIIILIEFLREALRIIRVVLK